jgi:hypothetical protein
VDSLDARRLRCNILSVGHAIVSVGLQERITGAFLRGAAAKAQGQLVRLDLGIVQFRARYSLPHAALLEVVTANAGSLRELRLDVPRDHMHTLSHLPSLDALARAAPLLRSFEAGADVAWQDAPRLLRAEPPLASLKLYRLTVNSSYLSGMEVVAPFTAALADTALQPTLSGLSISRASFDRPEVLDALVDALLPRRGLHKLDFPFCAPPAPVPLALLLRGNGLRSPI